MMWAVGDNIHSSQLSPALAWDSHSEPGSPGFDLPVPAD